MKLLLALALLFCLLWLLTGVEVFAGLLGVSCFGVGRLASGLVIAAARRENCPRWLLALETLRAYAANEEPIHHRQKRGDFE